MKDKKDKVEADFNGHVSFFIYLDFGIRIKKFRVLFLFVFDLWLWDDFVLLFRWFWSGLVKLCCFCSQSLCLSLSPPVWVSFGWLRDCGRGGRSGNFERRCSTGCSVAWAQHSSPPPPSLFFSETKATYGMMLKIWIFWFVIFCFLTNQKLV